MENAVFDRSDHLLMTIESGIEFCGEHIPRLRAQQAKPYDRLRSQL